MKKFLTLAVAAALVLLASGCASTVTGTVRLSELNPNLSRYQDNPDFDGILKTVTYEKIEKDNYDRVFYQAARILAVLKHLNFALDRVERSPAEFWTKASSVYKNTLKVVGAKSLGDVASKAKTALSSADPLILEALYPVVTADYILEIVPREKSEIEATVAAIQKLDPAKDFAYAGAFRIPALIKALEQTKANLLASVSEFDKLLVRVGVLSGKIVAATVDPAQTANDVKSAIDNAPKTLEAPPKVEIPTVPATKLPGF